MGNVVRKKGVGSQNTYVCSGSPRNIMGQRAPLRLPPVPRPRTNQHDDPAAHCLPLRSRGFHVPPIRPVASQTPTILGRKPTRKAPHHRKPSFRVGYQPDHAGNRENCFSAAIGGERRFPFVFPTRHKSVSPIPYTLRHRTLRGETIHPSPIPPYQSAPVSA